jgi:hypothetical protein
MLRTLTRPPDGQAPNQRLLAGGTPISGPPTWTPSQLSSQSPQAFGPLPLLAIPEPAQPTWLGIAIK